MLAMARYRLVGLAHIVMLRCQRARIAGACRGARNDTAAGFDGRISDASVGEWPSRDAL